MKMTRRQGILLGAVGLTALVVALFHERLVVAANMVRDGRTELGGDIMIHGKAASIGCIAIGDEAAEEIFTLAAETGRANVTVICSPVDFRKQKLAPGVNQPSWLPELYRQIAQRLSAL